MHGFAVADFATFRYLTSILEFGYAVVFVTKANGVQKIE